MDDNDEKVVVDAQVIEEISDIVYEAFASCDNYEEKSHLEELEALCNFVNFLPPKPIK